MQRLSNSASSRQAFTLVELLVTVSIAGLLISILIPAVSASRESARSTRCQNQLRSISVAAISFEGSRGQLPPGTLGVAEAYNFQSRYLDINDELYWKNYQYTSSLMFLLPYLERQNLVDGYPTIAFDIDRDLKNEPYGWFGEFEEFDKLVAMTMPEFRCPSDTLDDLSLEYYMSAIQPVFSVEKDSDAFAWTNLKEVTTSTVGITNYLGCTGAHSGGVHTRTELVPYTGLMSSRARLRLNRIKDGLSKTILYGETIGEVVKGRRTIAQSWLVGGIGRGRGYVPWFVRPHSQRMLGDFDQSAFVGFGSGHPAGIFFSFPDSHVRVYDRGLDWRVLYSLCGVGDGARLER